MRVYRLTLSRYVDTALSGEGARRVGGRWTPAGLPVVHASDTVSLAVLETLVHAAVRSMPSQRIIAVDIPAAIPVDTVNTAELPHDWRRTPAPATLRNVGRAWIHTARTAILRVPSAIVPLEFNCLLNPRHTDFRRLQVHAPERFEIDKRLFRPLA